MKHSDVKNNLLNVQSGKTIAIFSVIPEYIAYLQIFSVMTDNITKASKYNFTYQAKPFFCLEQLLLR